MIKVNPSTTLKEPNQRRYIRQLHLSREYLKALNFRTKGWNRLITNTFKWIHSHWCTVTEMLGYWYLGVNIKLLTFCHLWWTTAHSSCPIQLHFHPQYAGVKRMNIQLLHSSTKTITKTQMSEQEMLVVLKTSGFQALPSRWKRSVHSGQLE